MRITRTHSLGDDT